MSITRATQAIPVTVSFVGGQTGTFTFPPQRELPAVVEEPLPQTAPDTQPPALREEPAPLTRVFSFELPAVAPASWAEAADRFLAVLEALDAVVPARESLWVRLSLLGLTGATAIALFELGRQHLRKQRVEDLDLAFARSLEREPTSC